MAQIVDLEGCPLAWPELHRRNEEYWARYVIKQTELAPKRVRRHAADERDRDFYRDSADEIAWLFDTTVVEIDSASRRLLPTEARHALWLGLRRRGWALRRIGVAARRDGTSTVPNGIEKAERRVGHDEFTRKAVAYVEAATW